MLLSEPSATLNVWLHPSFYYYSITLVLVVNIDFLENSDKVTLLFSTNLPLLFYKNRTKPLDKNHNLCYNENITLHEGSSLLLDAYCWFIRTSFQYSTHCRLLCLSYPKVIFIFHRNLPRHVLTTKTLILRQPSRRIAIRFLLISRTFHR